MFVTGIGMLLGTAVLTSTYFWGYVKGYEDAESIEEQYQKSLINLTKKVNKSA